MKRHGRQAPRGMLVGAIVLPLLLGCLSSISTPSSARAGSGGEGHVYAWGDNRASQLGDGTTAKRTAPVAVALSTGVRIVSIAAARSVYSLAVDSDGQVYSWGANDDGQLGDGSTVQRRRPQAVALPAGVRALSAAAGVYQSLVVGSDGRVYAWGSRAYGEIGEGSAAGLQTRPQGVTLAPGVRTVSVAAGWGRSFAIGSDGRLYAWGGVDGRLFSPMTFRTVIFRHLLERHTPGAVLIPGHVRIRFVSSGLSDTLALGSDGRIYGWGNNYYGSIGDGTTMDRPTPTAVALPAGVRAVSVVVGDTHSLALGSDGRVYAWGDNTYGQLGDGTRTERHVPTAVALPKGVHAVSISAGSYDSMAVGSDGRLYAWGNDRYGQLGDGSTTERDTPEALSLPTGVKISSVSAGYYHCLALTS